MRELSYLGQRWANQVNFDWLFLTWKKCKRLYDLTATCIGLFLNDFRLDLTRLTLSMFWLDLTFDLIKYYESSPIWSYDLNLSLIWTVRNDVCSNSKIEILYLLRLKCQYSSFLSMYISIVPNIWEKASVDPIVSSLDCKEGHMKKK